MTEAGFASVMELIRAPRWLRMEGPVSRIRDHVRVPAAGHRSFHLISGNVTSIFPGPAQKDTIGNLFAAKYAQ